LALKIGRLFGHPVEAIFFPEDAEVPASHKATA
jgi:DNA-binding XRE family transcriptional regulator